MQIKIKVYILVSALELILDNVIFLEGIVLVAKFKVPLVERPNRSLLLVPEVLSVEKARLLSIEILDISVASPGSLLKSRFS